MGIYLQSSRSRARTSTTSGRLMLAVLPFANLTGDASQDYFSDGLTEEMISQLGDLDPDHVGVIARTSVMYSRITAIGRFGCPTDAQNPGPYPPVPRPSTNRPAES